VTEACVEGCILIRDCPCCPAVFGKMLVVCPEIIRVVPSVPKDKVISLPEFQGQTQTFDIFNPNFKFYFSHTYIVNPR
jgi:hypothetical protein